MAEPYLGSREGTAAILRKYGFSFRKKYGQNFLVDGQVLSDIVKAAGITPEDYVLEIGPGIGTLTQYLAQSARKVTAVEVDRMLIPILKDTLSAWENVELLNGDILKIDLTELLRLKNEGRPVKVAANLPYYITTPILMALFESGAPLESITVMVQKEVAERMTAGPGSKTYGALSLAAAYYARAEIAFLVPPSSFIPAPKVESAVVHMKRYASPPVSADPEMLFKLIRGSFNERRKTLLNGLADYSALGKPKAKIAEAIGRCGFPPAVRGEQLSLEEFSRLAEILSEG
ncbi:MAG: 16S rRNA (adenine(1518)-N(6)/adenine(1519)-N(6))-dimethyltransferase RsmA [Lachnospiraceae bacterium]|nr:16S rRNA (adenine(1518)-N(6)/adenine(1519)-N(6))-dimethyltransferase RsmA [Lachnospiraceae bacterium]